MRSRQGASVAVILSIPVDPFEIVGRLGASPDSLSNDCAAGWLQFEFDTSLGGQGPGGREDNDDGSGLGHSQRLFVIGVDGTGDGISVNILGLDRLGSGMSGSDAHLAVARADLSYSSQGLGDSGIFEWKPVVPGACQS